MKDAFAKLDYDGDETVTLSEMVQFERDRQRQESKLLVGIHWIGHTLSEDFAEDLPLLETLGLLDKEVSKEDGSKFHGHYEITSIG